MEPINLNILNHFPDSLLSAPANQLRQILPGPTLIHLKGAREPALFISVLLHGNETTGWQALQEVLRDYHNKELPRSLSIFIGNIDAAAENKRVLPHQMDYNRAWGQNPQQLQSPEQKLMYDVTQQMHKRGVFASIDIHNNTGQNPHYACVNSCSDSFLRLALMFSSTVVYFIKPDTVQSMAFAKICPAITVECGQPGHPFGTQHASQLIRSALNLEELSKQPVRDDEIRLYHTMATVKIPQAFSFSFHQHDSDIIFRDQIDELNFTPLHEGEFWADIKHPEAYLEVIDEQGNDLFARYFSLEDGKMISHIHLMPSMLTMNEEIVRQDCLCYIMEKIKPDTFR